MSGDHPSDAKVTAHRQAQTSQLRQSELTPQRIVEALDRHIIGQGDAKRSVAIALRNRWRRQQVAEDLREEINPKNILMVGPTGVGKTEIARRLAKLARAPFIKVEATRFTEVGYVGRDVSTVIKELMDRAVQLVRAEQVELVQDVARQKATDRVLDLLLPTTDAPADGDSVERQRRTREKFRRKLEAGELSHREVEIETEVSSGGVGATPPGQPSFEDMGINIKELFSGFMPKQKRKRTVSVVEALHILTQEEAGRLLDEEGINRMARGRVEQSGIVFLDEVDKIAARQGGSGPDVSREGVQRDLLPLVEGTTVPTRYGHVRTHHILFVAAGAFHVSKPSDLLPEFQGRFPIRVELQPLTRNDLRRILVEPKGALIKQYEAMMATEGVELDFTPEAVDRLAAIAEEVNSGTEDIGARRLHTVLERLLEEISFDAPEREGQEPLTIDVEYVELRLRDIAGNRDLSRYIL